MRNYELSHYAAHEASERFDWGRYENDSWEADESFKATMRQLIIDRPELDGADLDDEDLILVCRDAYSDFWCSREEFLLSDPCYLREMLSWYAYDEETASMDDVKTYLYYEDLLRRAEKLEKKEDEPMKKYTVKSGSQSYVIGTADTLEEALKISDAHLDHDPADDTNIRDAYGNDVFAWFDFIGEIMDTDTAGQLAPIASTADAQTTMDGWKASGVEIPAGLTAEALQWIWNWLLEQDDDRYAECVREDDEAEYQQTIREAASYKPPVREEDPIIKSLQTTLDYAYNRRDDEWKAYDSLRISEKPHLGMLDSQYRSYREAQSFLEGVTMAIFAAGYALTAENTETGRSTVCKK